MVAFAIIMNDASSSTQRSSRSSTHKLGKTFARISSGLQPNYAADHAVGIFLSPRMTAQVRELNQVMRTPNEAISWDDVTQSALGETTTAMQKVQKSADQVVIGTRAVGDQGGIGRYIPQIIDEINEALSSQLPAGAYWPPSQEINGKKNYAGIAGGQTRNKTTKSASVVAFRRKFRWPY